MTDPLDLEYPWLSERTTVEDYVAPGYYDKLLKDYVFEGKLDLEYLDEVALEVGESSSVLELGCGTGRATVRLLASVDPASLTLVDLSSRMLSSCLRRLAFSGELDSTVGDSIEFLETTDGCYDFVFSLWSYSHSAHQWLSRVGLDDGRQKIRRAFRRLVERNLADHGRCLIVHFDSQSEEQGILIRQWSRALPIFRDLEQQSPSKLILDEVLGELAQEGRVSLQIQHLVGDPIIYSSVEDAMENAMNFHLESYFNDRPDVFEVVRELKEFFTERERHDGAVAITPGCFIYTFERL